MNGSLQTTVLSLTGILHSKPQLIGNLSNKTFLTAIISKNASLNYYQGSYEFTPSSEEQVVHTSNKMVSRDIVINPIPSTYGRISWNGSFLTVS